MSLPWVYFLFHSHWFVSSLWSCCATVWVHNLLEMFEWSGLCTRPEPVATITAFSAALAEVWACPVSNVNDSIVLAPCGNSKNQQWPSLATESSHLSHVMGNVLSQPPTVKDTLYQDGVLRIMVCSARKRKDGHGVTTPCNKLDLPNCKKWIRVFVNLWLIEQRRVHCCSVFAHPETITKKKRKKKLHFFSYSLIVLS